MLKIKSAPAEDTGDTLEFLCDQCLPRVFRYISYWIHDSTLAEELTLRALRQALAKCANPGEHPFLIAVFKIARKDLRDHLKICTHKSNLSLPEQEVTSLRLNASLDNLNISHILGLSQPVVDQLVCQSLSKLKVKV